MKKWKNHSKKKKVILTDDFSNKEHDIVISTRRYDGFTKNFNMELNQKRIFERFSF